MGGTIVEGITRSRPHDKTFNKILRVRPQPTKSGPLLESPQIKDYDVLEKQILTILPKTKDMDLRKFCTSPPPQPPNLHVCRLSVPLFKIVNRYLSPVSIMTRTTLRVLFDLSIKNTDKHNVQPVSRI